MQKFDQSVARDRIDLQPTQGHRPVEQRFNQIVMAVAFGKKFLLEGRRFFFPIVCHGFIGGVWSLEEVDRVNIFQLGWRST